MLDKDQITQIQQGVANREGPMPSLYLDVNTGKPENTRNAFTLRAKDAMKALGVAVPMCQRVLDYLAAYNPSGRTPLLFALDLHARTGVVRLDQEHLQYFEVFLGEIEEVADAFRWASGAR
jgi:hypothetical protein